MLKRQLGSWKAVAEHFNVTQARISNIIKGVQQPSEVMCKELGIVRYVEKIVTIRYENHLD